MEHREMDWVKTLNLPKTDFPMKANLATREPEILKFWENIQLYKEIKNKNKGKKKYVLHDGPPYANGEIHMGHALNKILKDIIVKYYTMQGYDAPYIPGWDCHGLPIELNVTKDFKKTKEQLTKVEIRERCREFANKYSEIQKTDFIRLGVFGEWDSSYLTMSFDYEASILEAFLLLYEKGYIYRGNKPIYWCPHCATALAEAEVEYDDHTSHSIYVKFKLKDEDNTYLVIWTTTPWTLPANQAVCLNPDFTYIKIKVKETEECYIIASDLKDSFIKECKLQNVEIIEKISPSGLEHKKCFHCLYPQKESIVILGKHVTKESGTGCVHTAPGHGLEDYLIGIKYGMKPYSPVNKYGRFTESAGKYQGLFVQDANDIIIEDLKKTKLLVKSGKITHSYPHCWRCKNPVLFRATEQWFINVEHNNLRKNILDKMKEIRWIPAWGEIRFRSMIEIRPDWCLSRQRVWGVPLPAFKCVNCGNEFIEIEWLKEMINITRQQGLDYWFDEDYKVSQKYECSKCKSKNLKPVQDILDVWFDSGVSWYAVCKKNKELGFPVALYLEGSDQHRGWFQSSLICSMAIEEIPAFESVLTHGFLLDGEGRAMHKSAGNVISPQEVIKKHGADVLRLWVASEDYREDIRLSEKILIQVGEIYKRIRNTARFILGNISDFNPATDTVPYEKMDIFDKWSLSITSALVAEVIDAYDEYRFHSIVHSVNRFCTLLSSFYLDILKDRLYTHKKDDLQRRSSQSAMLSIITVLCRLLAPILSFTTEEIWRHLPDNKKLCVHLSSFPKKEELKRDLEIENFFNELLEIRDKVNKEREKLTKAGTIGSSLEAKIKLKIGKEYKSKLFMRDNVDLLLKEAFIVSELEIENIDGNELIIEATRTDGKKCPRCWKYSKFEEEICDICKIHCNI
ncbi:MAG: isoleucine--tRNA ligase [Candidatus Hydrogenedentota bacterium]